MNKNKKAIIFTASEYKKLKNLLKNPEDDYQKLTSIIESEVEKRIRGYKDSEEKYLNLFNGANDAIFLIKDDIIIECNKMTLTIFGFNSRNEIFQVSPWKISPRIQPDGKNSKEKAQEFIKKALNGTPQRFYWKHVRKDGTPFDAEVSLNRFKIKDKFYIQAIARDITEKLDSEKKLKIRTKELNNAFEHQKLFLDEIVRSSQFKTEFLARVSHELRTPLNAIIGFTDLLLEGSYGKLNEAQLDFLKDIKSSAKHQFDMITQILDISKIESGQLKLKISKFSLNNMIDQIISSLKPLYLKKGLEINIKGLESPKEICADPIRFKEIILNLLDNAIKFTIEGKITIIIQEKREQWVFKIKDTGVGIAEKDFDLIFNDFYRVDSPYIASTSGTGLGLPLIKRLVNLHGGDITFTSILGVGSTFSFTIPKELKKNINNKDGIK